MKTVILLEKDEFVTLKALLNDAKVNIMKCGTYMFRLNEAQRKLDEAIEILEEM